MNEKHIEDIITSLYDMVQDARSVPLSSEKCILERDKVLDMLDEIIAQLPAELKQSRTIVESRNELIAQARREAENIIKKAQEDAEKLVAKEAIYEEAKRRSAEHIGRYVLKFNAKIGGDHLAARKHRDITEHFLSSVAKAGSLNGNTDECAAKLIYDKCRKCLALNVLCDNKELFAHLDNLLKKRKDFLNI